MTKKLMASLSHKLRRLLFLKHGIQVYTTKTMSADNMLPPFYVRAHVDDPGADLKAQTQCNIADGGVAVIEFCGYETKIKPGHVGLLLMRSSAGARGLSLANGVGVIDPGYTGPIRAVLRYNRLSNEETHVYSIRPGDRVVQLVVVPSLHGQYPTYNLIDKKSRKKRSSYSLGSTGV